MNDGLAELGRSSGDVLTNFKNLSPATKAVAVSSTAVGIGALLTGCERAQTPTPSNLELNEATVANLATKAGDVELAYGMSASFSNVDCKTTEDSSKLLTLEPADTGGANRKLLLCDATMNVHGQAVPVLLPAGQTEMNVHSESSVPVLLLAEQTTEKTNLYILNPKLKSAPSSPGKVETVCFLEKIVDGKLVSAGQFVFEAPADTNITDPSRVTMTFLDENLNPQRLRFTPGLFNSEADSTLVYDQIVRDGIAFFTGAEGAQAAGLLTPSPSPSETPTTEPTPTTPPTAEPTKEPSPTPTTPPTQTSETSPTAGASPTAAEPAPEVTPETFAEQVARAEAGWREWRAADPNNKGLFTGALPDFTGLDEKAVRAGAENVFMGSLPEWSSGVKHVVIKAELTEGGQKGVYLADTGKYDPFDKSANRKELYGSENAKQPVGAYREGGFVHVLFTWKTWGDSKTSLHDIVLDDGGQGPDGATITRQLAALDAGTGEPNEVFVDQAVAKQFTPKNAWIDRVWEHLREKNGYDPGKQWELFKDQADEWEYWPDEMETTHPGVIGIMLHPTRDARKPQTPTLNPTATP